MVSPAYEVLRVLLYMICESFPNWDEFYCIYRVKDSTVYAVIEPFRLFQLKPFYNPCSHPCLMVSPAYELLRFILYMICANVVIEQFRLFQQNYSALPLCPSFS